MFMIRSVLGTKLVPEGGFSSDRMMDRTPGFVGNLKADRCGDCGSFWSFGTSN
jgi:hypothetical protein